MIEHGTLFAASMVRATLAGWKTQTRRVVTAHNSLVDGRGVSAKTWAALELDFAHAWVDAGPTPAGNAGPYLHVPSGREHGVVHRVYPRVQPGDALWGRETWRYADWTEDGEPWIAYRAGGADRLCRASTDEWAERITNIWMELSSADNYAVDNRAADRRWRTAIHLPRWAARLVLPVNSVRVERLQAISDTDAIAEGQPYGGGETCAPWGFEGVPHSFCDCPVTAYSALWESINGPGSWSADPMVWAYTFSRAP